MLSPIQVAEVLAKNTAEQVGKLTVALLYIVSALKKQPGFDTESFNENMREGAALKASPEDTFIQTVLLIAAGEDPTPSK